MRKLLSYRLINTRLMLLKSLIFLVAVLFFSSPTKSQNIKFGDVSPQDFDVAKLKVDTSKDAIIISDVGTSIIEGNSKSWFSLIFKRKCRILITGKNGFDLAKVEIPLYVTDDKKSEETIDKLRGTTYNLVNGSVIESKLGSDAIFKEKFDKNHYIQKFTMPAVKVGSIVEYSYTINSDFLFNLQSWEFQGGYPRVWSEYEVSIPEFFEYAIIPHGYVNFDINEHPTRNTSYDIRVRQTGTDYNDKDEMLKIEANVTDHRWVMKNVPALTEEPYTTTLKNHIAKLEFQETGVRFRDRPYRNVMGDWGKVTEQLMESDDFGFDLKRNNNWLDDDMKTITAGSNSLVDRAGRIYYYVKNNIRYNDYHGITLSKSLKEVFKSKNGSVAEINMLLIAMLKHEKIVADPIILSTRTNGKVNDFYPLLTQYNYLICRAIIGDKDYYLDASQPFVGFGHLPAYCFNGPARVISLNPESVNISPDILEETKSTNVMLFSDDKMPGKWEGNYKTNLGYNESIVARSKIYMAKAEFEKALTKNDYKISSIEYDDLKNNEEPLTISFVLKLGEDEKSDIIYFSPMLKEGIIKNPFESAIRKYPVEMPYKIDESYFLNIDIPAGYEVNEIPKSIKVMLNDSDGFFEYIVSKTPDGINLKSRIKLGKATFVPEDYETLRNFYEMIVKKQSEQIVFKKKK